MKKVILCLSLLATGCATQQNTQTGDNNTGDNSAETFETERLLSKGYDLLVQQSTKKAIDKYFDKAIDLCQSQYDTTSQKTYASRGLNETLYYLMMAATENKDAVAVSSTCADALYLKGYANLDLGRIDSAEEYIKRAIDMAPVNSKYLSELGHVYHIKRDWQEAFDAFFEAEKYAQTYSPEALKDQELARAKRGLGYSLIELGRLEEAKIKYEQCLQINSNDQGAIKELKYINSLQKQKSEQS